jgi:hypothetical protein
MQNCVCDVCFGKGWIETSVFENNSINNGTIAIEKCDSCNYFFTDLEAARFVFKNENIISFSVKGHNIKASIIYS